MAPGRPSDPFLYAHTTPGIVWMSQNTNHFPPHPAVMAALSAAIADERFHAYPFAPGLPGLPPAVLEDLGLASPPWQALLTGGGTEALYIIMRALLRPGDVVLTHDPSYQIIHHFIRTAGATPTDIPVYEGKLRYDVDTLQDHITPATKMILLIDPINPLGTGYRRDEVRAICELANDHDLLIVDDITYRDFAFEHTLTSEFSPERTLITYSFSKSAGLAGMRTGALVAQKELMDRCRPYNTNDLSINILGQVAALASLQTKAQWLPQVLAASRRNQALIKDAVAKVDGARLPVYPSSANMFVIDIADTGIGPSALQEALLYEDQVFVRSGSYLSKTFGERFIRTSFSIPTPGVERFCDAFVRQVQALRR